MAKYERHVFVCTNCREPGSARPCCNADGTAALHKAMKQAADAAGLKDRVRINKSGCLDQCEHGPNMVVYPEGIWYGRVSVQDAAEIVQSHLVEGRPVQRLMLDPNCINTPACEHKPRKS